MEEDLLEIRMALIGKTGVGKSASGNTILGPNHFHSEQSSHSVTAECMKQSAVVGNRKVTVIDTPDVFYGTQQENLRSEIEKSIRLASSGVHVILYVLPLTTFTVHETEYVSLYKLHFGEEVMRYTLILFTHGDKLGNKTVEGMIHENHFLLDFVNECGGRYHVLNNNDLSNRDQVENLLGKIDSMIRVNGDSCYTIEMLQKAERGPEEQLERIRQEKLREEEMEEIKHQTDLQEAIREAEEQVKKEMETQLETMRTKAQAQRESTPTEKKSFIGRFREAILQPKHCLTMSVLIIIAMGGMNVLTTPENLEKLKAFRQGCVLAVLPISLGAVSARTWMFIRRKTSNPESTSQNGKVVVILCGFAVGAMANHGISGEGGSRCLVAGLLGVYGAICFGPINWKKKHL